MKKIQKNYLKILDIEIDDLEEDIQFLIKQVQEKRADGKITNYVAMENQAVFKNEIHALKAFRKIVSNTNHENFTELGDLKTYLLDEFDKTMKTYGFAELTVIYVKRKIEKVSKYVCS